MISRAALALMLTVALLASAEAQNTPKSVRIGWLGLASPGPEVLRIVAAFKDGLRPFGYVEGQNLALEYRWANGQSERLPDLVAELVRLKVDVIAVPNTVGARAAREATTAIPIVLLGADAEALGLDLGRPGGNVTGVTFTAGPEIGSKYLELLKEAIPRTSRVAVLVRPENSNHAHILKATETAARSSKTQLQSVRARTPDDLDPAFATMARAKVDALIVLADPIFFLHRNRLAELAAKHRVPAIYGMTEHADAGGLMAYAANFPDVARRAATHVDRILKGAKPGDLPIEQPTRFELIINAKTARRLGLALAPSVLSRADRVIE